MKSGIGKPCMFKSSFESWCLEIGGHFMPGGVGKHFWDESLRTCFGEQGREMGLATFLPICSNQCQGATFQGNEF